MFKAIRTAIKFMKGGLALGRAHNHINIAWLHINIARRRNVITEKQENEILSFLAEARRITESAIGHKYI